MEIGETEKDNDQFSEGPPCHAGAEIKRALRWSSQPLDVPAEQRAVNLSREAIRRAQDSDEICRLIKKELESETIGNLQLPRVYVMEEGVICTISGEWGGNPPSCAKVTPSLHHEKLSFVDLGVSSRAARYE